MAALGTTLAVGESAPAAQAAGGGGWRPTLHAQDDWLDQVPGQHRFVFDTTSPAGIGGALLYANNFFLANKSGYGLQDADAAVVIVARHMSTPFAYTDAIWAKYGVVLARRSTFDDPKTKRPPTINVYNTAGYTELPSFGTTIDSLVKRGVHFAVCQMATRAIAGWIAQATSGECRRRLQRDHREPGRQRAYGACRDPRRKPRAGARIHLRHSRLTSKECTHMRSAVLVAGFVLSVAVVATEAQVTKASVPGISNFSKVETTVACAGATTPGAMAEVKRMGYASVITLRQASEQGADIDAEAVAAKAAGLNFVHLPFNAASPDPMLVDNFLKVVTDKANQPAFIHCASANRAAALWMVKRIVVDKWDIEQASVEAAALGLTSSALKTYALEQAQQRK